jgi:MoaA/NifB/PqqE/SkfB family radical SAM enzyme
MDPAEAMDWIRQIARYRNHHIQVLALTGGEPFYDLDTIEILASYGSANGLFVSAVTNAFWAASEAQACDTLKRVKSIRLLSISTDVYHQRFIPFERVRHAVAAANTHGVACSISICTDNEQDPEYLRILEACSDLVGREAVFTAVTFPVGRALERLSSFHYETTATPPISACSAGGSPIIFPDGRVIACIGPVIDLKVDHPLRLGDLRTQTLEEILDAAEMNSVLHAIRLWGPRKLIEMIEAEGLGQFLPHEFIKGSVCNACYSLMRQSEVRQFLNQLQRDPEFQTKVAYGRVYYLNETYAAEQLQARAAQLDS